MHPWLCYTVSYVASNEPSGPTLPAVQYFACVAINVTSRPASRTLSSIPNHIYVTSLPAALPFTSMFDLVHATFLLSILPPYLSKAKYLTFYSYTSVHWFSISNFSASVWGLFYHFKWSALYGTIQQVPSPQATTVEISRICERPFDSQKCSFDPPTVTGIVPSRRRTFHRSPHQIPCSRPRLGHLFYRIQLTEFLNRNGLSPAPQILKLHHQRSLACLDTQSNFNIHGETKSIQLLPKT